MINKKIALLLSLTVLNFTLFGKAIEFQDSLLKQQLQVKLDCLVINTKIPGANLSVVLENGEAINLSSGYQDMEQMIPMTPFNKMLSGSIGKTYVAAIAFKLIEENRLNLNDRVAMLLKDEPWISNIPQIDAITVEMLLSHTSGLPRYEFYDGVWNEIKMNPDKEWTVYDRLRYIFDAEPIHPAGTGWAYSDTNYILLGAVIEKITGTDYYSLFRKLISEYPMLKNTVPADQRKIAGLSSGYSDFLMSYGFHEKVAANEEVIFNPQMEWCGGGVASTAFDLACWAKLLYEGKVISPALVIKMVTPSVFETDLPDNAKYGLGAIITLQDSLVYYGHQGFFPGYRSIVQYNSRYRFAFALQLNRDNPLTEQSLNQLSKPFKELVILYLEKQMNYE